MPEDHPPVPQMARYDPVIEGYSVEEYAKALSQLDFQAVKEDIKNALVTSREFWPADWGHYGPLLVRLAWHCNGAYRVFDGRGGCNGGRIRFEPERSWEDNTNLDKARAVLTPIKLKYGLGLSWGDLIVLAGTTAIEDMGGPILGFCAGRVDEVDGSESLELGPSLAQEELFPCHHNGDCKAPFHSTTEGLLYVNPEGPMGSPDPVGSARQVRDTFARMGMNDSETVALVGGGHAFGKCHGACPRGPGPAPKDQPLNAWPGYCGSGKGNDTFTTGFELKWTPHPTRWDNDYFKLLAGYEWERYLGPAGHWQWRIKDASGPLSEVGMLTADVAMLHDPENKYQELVELWSKDRADLDRAFAHAWYKLMTRDMGPASRCAGPFVPPEQPWQDPLPPAPSQSEQPNFDQVVASIKGLLSEGGAQQGRPELLVRLAWRCAATFRVTDNRGGCNGARVRFAPEKDWPINAGLDDSLALLQPIKDTFGEGLTWADLIVLAGTVAIEESGGPAMKFCSGRSDALAGGSPAPMYDASSASVIAMRSAMRLHGLTAREWTALIGGLGSMGVKYAVMNGLVGPFTTDPTKFDNSFFTSLFKYDWEEFPVPEIGGLEYKARGHELYMMPSDLLLRYDDRLAPIAQGFASDGQLFQREFAAAWTKMMNADRFDGPVGNVCGLRAEGSGRRLNARALNPSEFVV